MQDRVPTKPNRYAVYDDAHTFLRYEYHERADEPTQVGDALNKANLLPDNVATALGLTQADPQVKDALKACAPWHLIQSYTTPGSFVFIVPGGITEIGAFVVSGGASGGITVCTSFNANRSQTADGGAAGKAKNLIFSVTPGQNIPVVVGAGGAAANITASTSSRTINGNSGGSSAFNGVSVSGTSQRADAMHLGVVVSRYPKAPMQGESPVVPSDTNFVDLRRVISDEALNIFNKKRYLGAGGGVFVSASSSSQTKAEQGVDVFDDATCAGGGKGYTYTGWQIPPLAGVSATGVGNGGGAIGVATTFNNNVDFNVTSGAGSAGAVLVYGR